MPNIQKQIFQILMELLANASFYGGLIISSLHTKSYILIKGIINNQFYDPMPYRYCAIKNYIFLLIRHIPQILQIVAILTNISVRVHASKISNGKYESSLGADTVPYRHV